MFLSKKAAKIKPSSTLAITAKAKEMREKGAHIISFGAGEPDFPTPEHIKEAAIEAIHNNQTRYTAARGCIELRQAISRKLKKDQGLDYTPDQIVVSNGAKHSLTNTFMALLNPGDEVVIPSPFWLSYAQMVCLADGLPVLVASRKETGFKLTPDLLEAHINDKTKAVIINSPSNPTGMVYSESELKALAEVAIKHDLVIISDEIYEKLIYNHRQHVSIASLGQAIKDRTVIINGVSKAYAMTGWRIGYAAAPEAMARVMSNMQSHQTSNPNTVAQFAAIEALNTPDEKLKPMIETYDQRRQLMVGLLAQIPDFDFLEPEGAFYVFINVEKVLGKKSQSTVLESAADLARELLIKKEVAVIPCEDFGFKNHIRLSYAISQDEIKEGVGRIKDYIQTIN